VLEQARGGAYRQVLAAQRAKVADPELTPSARVLAEMRAHGESFHGFARRQAEGHRRHLAKLALTPGREAQLEQEAAASLVRQAAIEAADDVDFGAFLDRYFSQA
jgi:glutamate--cysteine ligase